MKKLYMRQKVFSWKDRFSIQGEDGSDQYWVEGEFFSLGKKLHLYDMTGNEVAFIRQKISLKPRFFVYVRGIETAEIVREFSLRPRYTIHGLGWEVRGNFSGHDFEVFDRERCIVRVHKAWLSWGDSYEIDVLDDRDEINALAVVLAIDAVIAETTVAVSASSSSS